MEPERALFLTTAFATHAAVGYALVATFTEADPRLGALLGVLPDSDFLFPAALGPPFVHRGVTHAPAVVIALTVAAFAVRRRRADALAVALATGSHLAIDALSPMGIPLWFPLEFAPTSGPGLSVHGPTATVLLWSAVGALLYRSTDSTAPELLQSG